MAGGKPPPPPLSPHEEGENTNTKLFIPKVYRQPQEQHSRMVTISSNFPSSSNGFFSNLPISHKPTYSEVIKGPPNNIHAHPLRSTVYDLDVSQSMNSDPSLKSSNKSSLPYRNGENGNKNTFSGVNRSFLDVVKGSAEPDSNSLVKEDFLRLLNPISTYQGKPAVMFSSSYKKSLVESLKFVLIGKFSHGRPQLKIIYSFFYKLKLKGSINISVLDNKHIFIECLFKEDFYHIWMGLTWRVDGMVMRVFKWYPEFSTSKESSVAPVWIRIEGLPLFLFEENSLMSIANSVGTPIKVDPRNINRSILNKAWVCVELDVQMPLFEDVWVCFVEEVNQEPKDGFWAKIYYELVPDYCAFCSHIGHKQLVCKRRINHDDSSPLPGSLPAQELAKTKSVIVVRDSFVEDLQVGHAKEMQCVELMGAGGKLHLGAASKTMVQESPYRDAGKGKEETDVQEPSLALEQTVLRCSNSTKQTTYADGDSLAAAVSTAGEQPAGRMLEFPVVTAAYSQVGNISGIISAGSGINAARVHCQSGKSRGNNSVGKAKGIHQVETMLASKQLSCASFALDIQQLQHCRSAAVLEDQKQPPCTQTALLEDQTMHISAGPLGQIAGIMQDSAAVQGSQSTAGVDWLAVSEPAAVKEAQAGRLQEGEQNRRAKDDINVELSNHNLLQKCCANVVQSTDGDVYYVAELLSTKNSFSVMNEVVPMDKGIKQVAHILANNSGNHLAAAMGTNKTCCRTGAAHANLTDSAGASVDVGAANLQSAENASAQHFPGTTKTAQAEDANCSRDNFEQVGQVEGNHTAVQSAVIAGVKVAASAKTGSARDPARELINEKNGLSYKQPGSLFRPTMEQKMQAVCTNKDTALVQVQQGHTVSEQSNKANQAPQAGVTAATGKLAEILEFCRVQKLKYAAGNSAGNTATAADGIGQGKPDSRGAATPRKLSSAAAEFTPGVIQQRLHQEIISEQNVELPHNMEKTPTSKVFISDFQNIPRRIDFEKIQSILKRPSKKDMNNPLLKQTSTSETTDLGDFCLPWKADSEPSSPASEMEEQDWSTYKRGGRHCKKKGRSAKKKY